MVIIKDAYDPQLSYLTDLKDLTLNNALPTNVRHVGNFEYSANMTSKSITLIVNNTENCYLV